MHVKTYALGIVVALGTTMVCFAGCGSTVNEGTGASHTTTSSSSGTGGGTMATGTTSSASSSSSGSSGTGGGSVCDQACAHAAMCGDDVCTMFGINCATAGTQYDCLATCLNDVPCAELPQQALGCYQSCQGDGGTGGTSDGGTAVACEACAGQSCQASAGACVADTQCEMWLGCVNGCTAAVPGCVAACNTMYASSAPLYTPLFVCTCNNCSSQCSMENPCAYAGDGG